LIATNEHPTASKPDSEKRAEKYSLEGKSEGRK